MKPTKISIATIVGILMLSATISTWGRDPGTGNFSLGTRNTISAFSDDNAIGIGIGGQFRFQFNDRLNSEWYADYIPSHTARTHRVDYHIGWSVMVYPGKNIRFDKFLQPYFIAGHCFDYSIVYDSRNTKNSADRFTCATQAGIGTHLNITKRLDCSLSAQYMLHFGREIEVTEKQGEEIRLHRSDDIRPDGHLLFTVSFNYKFVNFRSGWKSI